MPPRRLPHLLLPIPPETHRYTGTGGGSGKPNPLRQRASHGALLRQRFDAAWQQVEAEQAVTHFARHGVYLEFKSDPGYELELMSLEDLRKGIRLLNVRMVPVETCVDDDGPPGVEPVVYATVYIPQGEKQHFIKKLERYLAENTKTGKPRNGQLIDSIADIRKALLVDSFWSDVPDLVPGDSPEWIEVWLSTDADAVLTAFDQFLAQLQIPAQTGLLRFPERSVKVIFANHAQLEQLTAASDHIAEYRRAKATAAFWMALSNREQAEWVEDLLGRSRMNEESQTAVCILDTGVNNGHPLLEAVLADEDCHAFDTDWGTHDHHERGHGTRMAGIVAYGDLKAVLQSSEAIELGHRLESVKILPPTGENEKALWGHITSQAINRAAIQAPDRNRCICIAVTADDSRDRGRPSSWSAELDQLAAGAEDEHYRLILVSAGNVTEDVKIAAANYPDAQITDAVHDPAQSWNALTVGAYTQLDQISDPALADYTPVAPREGLSPFTTTSATWEENQWPVKPELLLEGGNLAVDGGGFATECDDLSLLTTHKDPQEAHFSDFNMTSAATAQLGWMAGNLMTRYPDLWPETVRGLLVHSATWPDTLKRQFLSDEKKASYKSLLKIAGYGVPDLERALFSAENRLTLISQARLQPFEKKPKGGYRTRDMHFYALPWPKDVLLDLPHNTPVQMRITLSYFVEPGPGEVGWKDRYRYASHGLRFELNAPGESREELIKRINQEARDKDEGKPGTQSPSDHWVLGSQARNRGSLHSDIWQGTAQELADSNLIAISSTIGWWRERNYLGKWNKAARYALIVSIATPEETVDLYTPVAIALGIAPTIEITT